MSLQHPGIEAFLSIVRHSTVHGAARDIGLSQTGVTQRIRSLERQLRTTLFTRSRKGMNLTEEGEALYRYCQRVQDLEGEYLTFLHTEATTATVNVSVTGPSSLMRSRIIPQATKLLKTFPNITFSFFLDDYETGLRHLKNGSCQLAVMPREDVVNELDSKILRPAVYVLVGPPEWRKRPLEETISTERIVDFNESDDATFRYLRRHGLLHLAKKQRHLANSPDALVSMVADGLGYTVLFTEFAGSYLEEGRLVDLNPGKKVEYEGALAWYPRREMPSYFRHLIKNIR